MENHSFQLAIVGCGRWGINHIRTAYRIFGKNLKYVCDVNQESAKRVEDISPEICFVTSFETILNCPEVNAVIIATPAETHYQLAKRCLEANKNILIEKPITLFSYQGRELAQLAKKKDLTLMVGHLLLYHPGIRKIKEIINNGELGKLQYIYSNRLNLGSIRKEENILWSFAPHDISLLQYFIEDDPLEVDAKGGVFVQPGIHDVTLTMLRYPRNICAHIHVSWLHPFKEHRLVIIGDKSMVVFEDSRKENKLLLYAKGFDWINGEPHKRDGDYQVISYSMDEPLKLEQEHFADCVINKKTPLSDGNNGIKVLEILEQAQARLENRKVQKNLEEEPKNYFAHKSAYVDEGCSIGDGTKIWHFSHVQRNVYIGEKCSLGQNVNVGNNVRIGNSVKIQNNVSIYEGVELEDYVFCGPSMVFTNILKPRCEFPQRGSEFYQKTLVKLSASIGANATIVCGITVGRYAFIGAGTVVTKDVPDYALILGNPGRLVGWMCRCGERLPTFHENKSTCSKCQRSYCQENEKKISPQEGVS